MPNTDTTASAAVTYAEKELTVIALPATHW